MVLWVMSSSWHYMRKTQRRHTRTKNGNTQIMCLYHRVSHYRVIRDAQQSVSPIRIHLIHALGKAHLLLQSKSESVLRVCVANLITDLGYCNTNMRCAKGHASPMLRINGSHTILIKNGESWCLKALMVNTWSLCPNQIRSRKTGGRKTQ
jgi:hypothetical protein